MAMPSTFLGLPARERARRRAQPRHHPAGRRSLERRVRGGRQQHQGHDGDAASVRAAAVRRRPRPAFPHADRHRRESRTSPRWSSSASRSSGRSASSTASPRPASRCSGLRHRAARRPRHDHARVEGGARIPAVGEREASRRVRAARAVGVDQVRRVGHDLRLRRQPDRGRRVRQALRRRLHAGVRRDHRAHRRRDRSSPRAAATTRCAPSSCACSTATRR